MAGRYPNRRNEDGESPIQSRSLTQYCSLGKLKMMRDCIGQDVWDELKNSSVGVFLKLVDIQSRSKYVFASTTVHYFLTQQLAIENDHEFWSLIGDQPLRFSLHEYRDITGLRCDPYPEEDASNSVDHEAFWSEMRVPVFGGPTWSELAKVLKRCQGWTLERRMMLGRLCILNVGIYGKHHESRIPLDGAKRVFDPETFEQFPWGRLGFSCLLDSIKKVRISGNHYSLYGCVHVLLIWVYESVHAIGELYGLRRGLVGVPPLLNWRGSRQRFRFEDLIADEKAKHGKVRVRHMLSVAPENKYPQWSENENNLDPRLDNLLDDIISDQLVPVCWAATKKVSKKKKRVWDEHDQTSKQKKLKKQQKLALSSHVEDKEDITEVLLKLVATLVDKVQTIGNQNEEFVDMVKARLQAMEQKIEQKMGHAKHVDTVSSSNPNQEEEKSDDGGANSQTPAKPKRPEVAINKTSSATGSGSNKTSSPVQKHRTPIEILTLKDDEDEESCKQPSWLLQPGSPGSDGLPVTKVVKRIIQADQSSEDVEDVTDRQNEENLKMASSSGALIIYDEKRVPKLADTQKSPYIPNSTVKRIIPGVKTSGNDYDPMLPVAEEKWKRFDEWMNQFEGQPFGATRTADFFTEIIIPRSEWTAIKYGWLRDEHLAAALEMFRLRDMRLSSPFRARVGFIDQWFMSAMQNEFRNRSPKSKTLPFDADYLDHFNGNSPLTSATEKRWWHEIDNLYGIVNVKRNHWVAVDINFPMEKIFVYDSIPDHTPDKELVQELMFLRKMIPNILNIMVPEQERRPHKRMFELTRVKKNVPVNENPGDCGVYALKYVECLALGWSFEGLNDRTIMSIRRRLAAELFDEVPDLRGPYL